jgi:FkbM family methyltransferase
MQSEHFRSQSGQDKYIYENLLHKEGGHFLEVGAFDGVYLSNTYFFEKQLGWTGILIEMKPDLFAGMADRRSGSKCYNCALGLENMDMLYFDAGDRSGLLRYYEPEGIEYLERHYQPQQTKPAFQLKWINVRPIMDIIAEAGFRELDYFSLDVEGAELQILSMIDFSRIRIKVFTVEDNWGMWKKPREFLRPFGYQFIGRLHGDGFFVHESHMDALFAQHGKDYLNHLKAGLDQVIE